MSSLQSVVLPRRGPTLTQALDWGRGVPGRTLVAALVAVVMPVLAGCGQKGPLVLPSAPAASAPAGAPSAATPPAPSAAPSR